MESTVLSKDSFGFLCLIYDPILNRIISTGQSDLDVPYNSYADAENAMLAFVLENPANASMRYNLVPFNIVYKNPRKEVSQKSFEPLAYRWVIISSIQPFNEHVVIAQSPKGVNYISYSDAYENMLLTSIPDLPLGSTLLKSVIPVFPYPKHQERQEEVNPVPPASSTSDVATQTDSVRNPTNANSSSLETTIDEIIRSVIEEVMKGSLTPTTTATEVPAETPASQPDGDYQSVENANGSANFVTKAVSESEIVSVEPHLSTDAIYMESTN